MKKTKYLGVALAIIALLALVTAGVIWFTLREPAYAGKNLSAWLADLDNTNAKQRTEAEQAIVALGTNSLPLLVAEFDLQHHGMRETLRRLLTKAGILKINLPAPDQRFKRATRAFKLLGDQATPALPALVPLLDQAPGYVPIAMGYIGTNALPDLFAALKHPNWAVQNNSLAALTQMLHIRRAQPADMKPAIPLMIEILSGTNNLNRARVAELFRAIGPTAAEASTSLQKAAKTTDPGLSQMITRSLAVVDPDNSWHMILELSRDQLQSTNSNIRITAVMTLANLPPHIREPIPLLITCLDDSAEMVRFTAAGALGRYGAESKEIVPHLIKALSDTKDSVRLAATTALGNYGAAASNSLPFLHLTATNDVPTVQGNARTAIKQIEAELRKERSQPAAEKQP